MIRVLGFLLVVLGTVLLTPAGAALNQLATAQSGIPDGFADPSDPQVIPTDPNPPPSDGPELTQAQRDRAVSLALGDSRVQGRLAGKTYQVQDVGPWSTGGATDTLVGAIVVIRLGAPASYPLSTWPVPAYDGPGDTSYRDGSVRVAAANVTDLVVSVDLGRSRVVGIEPDGDDVAITTDEAPRCHTWDAPWKQCPT